MNIGTLLLGLSFLTALGSIVLYGVFFVHKEKDIRSYAQVMALATFALNSIAILLLTYYFLSSNLDFQYVWEYSAQDSPWYLKLSGVWAGQEGSFFFWTWLILLSIAIEVRLQMREDARVEAEETALAEQMSSKSKKKKSKGKGKRSSLKGDLKEGMDISRTAVFDWTIAISMTVVLVFLILVLVKNPFEAVDEDLLDIKPDGNGLNPLLRNYWMVVHPPLLFIGYALVTIPFAASMANLITDDKRWSSISLQWSRISWLFLTLGIGIGAIWAYVELAFGGYWAWDPVEVGSFIPWFILTAFMHAQLMNKRKGEYKFLVSVLGMATFVLVIFATYITRSGVWDSVHAWQETTVGNILLSLMGITVILSGLVIYRRFIEEEEEKEVKYTVDFVTMFSTIILLSLIGIVMIIGLLVSKGTPNPAFYETRLFPFVFPLTIMLGACLIWAYMKWENMVYAFGWIILAGAACAVVLPRYVFPGESSDFYGGVSDHRIIAFFVPMVLVAIGSAIYRIHRAFRIKSISTALKVAGPHLIHLGIALMIISYAFSMKMAEEKTIVIGIGETSEFGDYEFTLLGIEESREREKETHAFEIEIHKNGNSIGTKHPKYVYYNDVEQWRTEVAIKMRVTHDVYINILSVDPDNNGEIDSVQLKVSTIPLMGFLWTGMFLMAAGISIVIFMGYEFPSKTIPEDSSSSITRSEKATEKKERARSSESKRETKKEKELDDKYAKMLEDELNNL